MVVIRRSAPQGGEGGEQNSAYGSLRHFSFRFHELTDVPTSHVLKRCCLRCVLAVGSWRRRRRQQPPGQIRPRPAEGRRAGVPAADHPRIQAAVDARRAAAPGAAREVSGHRLPQPPADADLGRTSSNASVEGDGRRSTCRCWSTLSGIVRRSAAPGARRDAGQPVQGSDGAVRRTSTSRDVGPGFGAEGRRAARSRHQGRRARAGEIMKDFGLFVRKADGTRLQRRRSGARSGLGDVRAA